MSEERRKDKPESCECCHFDTEALQFYPKMIPESYGVRSLWLCDLCASSLAGNMASYPRVHSNDLRLIAGLIMNAANHILAELRKGNHG